MSGAQIKSQCNYMAMEVIMQEKILNLLAMCMQAKDKGHDCFFYYMPHTDTFEITVYVGGWDEGKDRTCKCAIRASGVVYENEIGIKLAEKYLKGLLA